MRIEARSRISAAYGSEKCRPDAVPRDVRQRDDKTAVSQLLPIEVITTRCIGGQIPTADLHPFDGRASPRQKRLLNRPGNLQIMLNLFQLALHLGLAQSCLHMLANLSAHHSREKAARQQDRRVEPNGRLSRRMLAQIFKARTPSQGIRARQKAKRRCYSRYLRDPRIQAAEPRAGSTEKTRAPTALPAACTPPPAADLKNTRCPAQAPRSPE